MNLVEAFSTVTVDEINELVVANLEDGEEAIGRIFDWRLSLLRSMSFGSAGLAFSLLVAMLVPLLGGSLHFSLWEKVSLGLALGGLVILSSWTFLRCVELVRDFATSLRLYSDLSGTSR
jgi:hypothetical protein